ncbi:MAG: imidazoleglycerol-phosphate dehydratase [Planctomycetes bacterium]|nr:imidazoleglycerol-phosphate dehydratase [Planctomycetota bacterium]
MIRETKETRVEVIWAPAGTGRIAVSTGIGFLDHMLHQWAFHGGFDLTLTTQGDLHIDTHHTVEDTALALGEAVDACLGDRSGLARFGWTYIALEESLARAVVDLARRPFCAFRSPPLPATIGALPGEMAPHFFRSFAMSARLTLHIDILQGENGHHMLESAFKALGIAMAQALRPSERTIASTKGTLR